MLVKSKLSDQVATFTTDMESIKPSPTSFVSRNNRKFISDMVFEAKIAGKKGYFVFIIEHQSSPEKLMPVRFLEYTVCGIRLQLDATGKDTFPLIVPFIVYQSDKPYPYSTDIRDLVDAPRELVDKYFLTPVQMIDLAKEPYERFVDNVSLFNMVAYTMKVVKSKQPNEFKAVLRLASDVDPEGMHKITDFVLEYLVSEMQKVTDKDDVIEMVDWLPAPLGEKVMTLAQHWEYQGMQQGMQKGIRETALNMLKKNCDISFVSEVTGLSLAELKELNEQKHN